MLLRAHRDCVSHHALVARPRPGFYEFEAQLFRWEGGQGAWYFVALPPEVTDEIDEAVGAAKAGFGSVPVKATVGSTTWATSVFPDTKRKAFILPVKKAVRQAAGIDDGDTVAVRLEIDSARRS